MKHFILNILGSLGSGRKAAMGRERLLEETGNTVTGERRCGGSLERGRAANPEEGIWGLRGPGRGRQGCAVTPVHLLLCCEIRVAPPH